MSPTPAPSAQPLTCPEQPSSAPNAPPGALLWEQAAREKLFDAWFSKVQKTHQLERTSLQLASADASFRRYLRVNSPAGSRIIMDAPPQQENSKPFVQVAGLMADAGIRAPQILDWDDAHGFMLLSDLGTQTMLQAMRPNEAPPQGLYLQAVDILIDWQRASRAGVLPVYDQALLRRELELFPQWYVGEHRKITLQAAQRQVLDEAFTRIIQHNLSWPSVYVHRDFMPRNLILADQVPPADGRAAQRAPMLGVLDFQDAVYGPITYDIASLMRDAFVSWEEDFCLDITIRYWEKARKAGLPVGDDFGAFYQGVEWMGLQRHLKVAGIFARLSLRDGKPHYLADSPRFIHYIRSTCARYRALHPLLALIESIEDIASPSTLVFGRI